ncbi:hypothetical protein ARAM_004956 [Aspergillus rambellii]|uniref:C2H2-type domain-containing protein n=1 Tax=Aspergillus rambellii TaxID=308745 RepID=A0A0F8VSN4_9EURO|nr:hypothetical protein ARAM_004956 [Aspergillus rambellii]
MSSSQEHDSIRAHPRRRPFRASRPSLESSSAPSHPRLRKGETFHASSRSSSDRDLILPLLPRRSPTCPGALEAIAAGQQRMSNILDRLDLNSFNTPTSGEDHDDLPVPKGLLELHIQSQSRKEGSAEPRSRQASPMPKGLARKSQRAHCHASDSGLGTSISSGQSVSSANKVKAGQLSYGSNTATLQRSQSAITRSITALEPRDAQQHKLTPGGRTEIEKHILGPLLEDECLKPFHPLLEDVRQQIEDERISSLRDLEKTVFSLAPDVKIHDAAYVRFCQHTILCLGQTVSFLNDRDLCMPADRQYSNGYFVDLLEQVTRFKRIRDEMRKRSEEGKAGEKRVAYKEPKLIVEGGLSQTGRPLELVAQKDGKLISLRTGKPYEELAVPSMKRTLSYGSADEGAQRSMARRKKNAPPMNINKKCKDCDKVFSRPCDLTKHEKSHTRPFKCPVPSCKYHTKGWATEKESERHYNDKHSEAPRLYACQFESCSYKSKRESNCKQHMEKTHGWVYMRSKNNGRTAKRSSIQQSPAPSSSSSAQPQHDLSNWDMTPASATPEFKHESTGWDMGPHSETPEFSFNAFQPPMAGIPTPVTGTAELVTPTTGTINSPSEPYDMASENTAFSIQDIFPDMKASDGVLFTGGDLDFVDFSNQPSMFNDFLTGYPDITMQPQGMNYGDMQQPQYDDDSAGFLLDVYNDMQTYGISPGGL